jgi:predicted alpha/beta hydrolase
MQTDSNDPTLPALRTEPVRLVAADACVLGGTLTAPERPASGTVIIHGATAVPARYYRSFSAHLARSGIRVLTYDYRGVGASRPESLRGFRATMTDWARLDARAAHHYVQERFPGEPVGIVGHSFGGQLVGLVDEARDVSGALFVGAQLGYYGLWPALARPRLAFLLRAVIPALTRLVGYLPGRAGLGEDLPRGVAEEWARWCTSPEYLVSHHRDAAERFARFDRPLLMMTFEDDDYAPKKAVLALASRLRGARLHYRSISPRDPCNPGGAPIGHFGFFRPRFRDSLWVDAERFFRDVFAGREPARRPPPSLWGVGPDDVMADLCWGRA